jgi:DNA adenine methylase
LEKNKKEISTSRRNPPSPFLKWAGGKRQVLPALRESIPKSFGRYYEPFVGGGALFFDLKPKRALLSDTNGELIKSYQVVRDNVGGLIKCLKKHIYEEEHYYEVRAWDTSKRTAIELAARMIFLNKTGFNGLYRVNSKGLFNVPFGRHKNPTICDVKNLKACSDLLQKTKIESADFKTISRRPRADDFVYFDPPYIPLSRTANFTSYQKNGFGMDNQELLATVFEKLAERGVQVMLSNSDVPWMHDRYASFNIRTIQARRNVSSNSASRGPVGEVIVTSY